MTKFFVIFLCTFFGSSSVFAQYTETINSNRPGNSQGAFAVGLNVLQLETGVSYGHNNHHLKSTETNLFGIDYALRYGLSMERLEISLMGTYLSSNETMLVGANEITLKSRNFKNNTLGIKYLIYDPYRLRSLEERNIRSWDANYEFKWRDLIPAVSIYAGMNMLFGDNPYMFPEEPSISPKFVLATQHNYLSWVFVMNFIADKVSTDFPTYAGIFTLTHSFNRRYSVFGEYQIIKNDLYSDNILRGGAAYLINKNFQVDLSGLINFKDTPSRWQVAVGVSYRLDMHTVDEYIIPKDTIKNKEELKQTKKDPTWSKTQNDSIIKKDSIQGNVQNSIPSDEKTIKTTSWSNGKKEPSTNANNQNNATGTDDNTVPDETITETSWSTDQNTLPEKEKDTLKTNNKTTIPPKIKNKNGPNGN